MARKRVRLGKLGPGRCLLTVEIADKIVNSVRKGCYPYPAAQRAGINSSTFAKWVKQADEGVEPYFSLLSRIDEAEAESECGPTEDLHDLTHFGSPETKLKAISTFLERRFADRWSRGERRDVNLNNTGNPLALIVQTTGDKDAGSDA